MKRYEVVAPVVNVISGTVRVTPDQFRARRHALALVGEAEDGTVEATVSSSVGFKRGEVFGYDGEMPKCLALCLEALEPEPEAEIEPQAEATAEHENVPESEDAGEVIETMDIDLEDMDREELLSFAKAIGLNPHPNTGKPKLIELIRAREDEMVESGELKVEE